VPVVGPFTYKAGMIVNVQGPLLVTLLTVVWGVGNIPWNDTDKFQFKYLNLRHLLHQSTVKPTEITDQLCHLGLAYFRALRTKFSRIEQATVKFALEQAIKFQRGTEV
jgi:hypothetical protein